MAESALDTTSNFSAGKKYKPSSQEEALAAELIQDWNYLYGLRGNWMVHWTEIAQRILPMHSYLFQNYEQLSIQGDKRNQELYDSTGALALGRFGAILDSLLTPRDTFWHHVRSQDAVIMRNKACQDWFDQCNQILFKQRYAATANFASNNQNVFLSLGAYGTGALFIDAFAGAKGVRYRNTHLSEIYLQENHQGMVDRVCRRFMLTARQATQQFKDSCPEIIWLKAKTAPDEQYFFLHWVQPRKDHNPERYDAKGMPYESHYVSIEGRCMVYDMDRPKDQGYRTFPYVVPRYYQAPNEAYGRSPAMDCLPSLKTLNEQKKTMLKQGHRALDPVLLAHDDGIVDAFNMQPGAVNAGGISADGRVLVQPLPIGNIQAGKEMMDEERNLINDSFLVSLFQILTESPEMTATEVMERTREKGILLAPTIGRQQSEYLGPLIDREIDVLSRQGLLPKMPPMLAQAKGEYKIVYDSPISRTQKAEYASGAVRTLEILGNYAQQTGDRSSLNIINIDVAGPEIADIQGVPAHWLNSPEKIQALKRQQQKEAAMQAAVQAGPAQAALMNASTKAGMSPQAPQAGGRKKQRQGQGPLGKI